MPGDVRIRKVCFAIMIFQRWLAMFLLNKSSASPIRHGRGSGAGAARLVDGMDLSMSRRIRQRKTSVIRRRRFLLHITCRMTVMIAMVHAAILLERLPRSVIIRHGMWWEQAYRYFTDQQWRENFRMGRETFMYLVEELRADLEEKTKVAVISVEKRVAIALWRLATPNAFRCISQLFGVGRTTAWYYSHQVCNAIVERLLSRFVVFPQGEYLQEVKEGFRDRGMPQAVGAIDGTHIPIKAPKENHGDYFNRKCFFSVILQAVVDHKCRFTDIYVGWPGSVHDARVLSNSSLYRKAQEGILLPEERELIAGVEVPLYIIGDPAYPLRSWLMKGYPDTGRLTEAQINFNERLSSARMVVERSFGLLKGRWRSLSRANESKVENMPNLIAASCVLHNMCQSLRDELEEVYQEPGQQHQVLRQDQAADHRADEATPVQYRAALTQFLAR